MPAPSPRPSSRAVALFGARCPNATDLPHPPFQSGSLTRKFWHEGNQSPVSCYVCQLWDVEHRQGHQDQRAAQSHLQDAYEAGRLWGVKRRRKFCLQGGLDGGWSPIGFLNAAAVRASLPGVAHSLAGQAHGRQLDFKLVLNQLGNAREDGLKVVLHARTSQPCQTPFHVQSLQQILGRTHGVLLMLAHALTG